MTSTEHMRVLFLCTHNSSRSQMAEGLLRARGGNRYRAFSAGTHPYSVHPLAVKIMAELDIDISEAAGHCARGIEEFSSEPPIDLVITVCDEAAEECPYFPNARQQRHWSFPGSQCSDWLRGRAPRLLPTSTRRHCCKDRCVSAWRYGEDKCMTRLPILGGSDAGISVVVQAREVELLCS